MIRARACCQKRSSLPFGVSAATDSNRQRVLDALSLLAAAPVFASLRPDLRPERFAYMMCQVWFDEVYEPGTRYMSGLKGDRDAVVAEQFLAEFDDDEERWLERFNRFLELRIDRLADHEAEIIEQGERWDSIVRDAGYLVELLGGNPKRPQGELTAAAQKWLPAAR